MPQVLGDEGEATMSTNHDVSKLDDLIVTTIDSIRGYEQAAEHADAGRYASFFAEMASERLGVVEALSNASRDLGGTPADYGSTAATVHRRWEDLRRVLGGGDDAILKEVERGEDYLKEEFDRVLNDDRMTGRTQAVVRDCYQSVQRGHDQARALRDQLAAAD
jgi:uncharacterized protein (TIGR02284 family)